MGLQFKEIELDGIGRRAAVSHLQWATLELKFLDPSIDHNLSVGVNVLVPKSPDVTLRELQESARDSAIILLEAALDALKGNSVTELSERQLQREESESVSIEDILKPQQPPA